MTSLPTPAAPGPRVELLIIDPQNDFCDLPDSEWPAEAHSGQGSGPALPVAGAHADMLRLAEFIRAAAPRLSAITVTLDSHHRRDIAHPGFWQRGDGAPVTPFTSFAAQDVREGRYRPREAADLPRALAYLDELEARGRYRLMVWPVHCEIGSWGHAVHAAVRAAYNGWEEAGSGSVRKLLKGSNPWTEHYSALQAEVPDPADPGTQLDPALLAELDRAELLLIAGEASSHCVKATTEHLVEHLPSRRPNKLVLLTDCMSPVGGFETQHREFLDAMRAQGVRLATTGELLHDLGLPQAVAV
jgi:nicotinamidase-related amidase